MSIPDFQTIMLPLLKFLGDKKEHSLREAIEYLLDEFNLSEEERKELLRNTGGISLQDNPLALIAYKNHRILAKKFRK